jgi:hypothetical protein
MNHQRLLTIPFVLTPEQAELARSEASRQPTPCCNGHYTRREGCGFCHRMLERTYALDAQENK